MPLEGQPAAWQTAELISETLAPAPEANAHWGDVPAALNAVRKLKVLERSLAQFLYDNAKLGLLENRKLEAVSKPGDDAIAFAELCRELARREADKELAASRTSTRHGWTT